MLVAWAVGPRTARAGDCLAQPNSSAPAGNHWYYHTDRATQRKCWYLRALDQPAQGLAAQTASQATPTGPIPIENSTASGDASTSALPGASTPSLPHTKMLSVVSSVATDQLVQQRAKQRNTTSITAASAPEQSTFQAVDQANEPARASAIVWPDPATPPAATVQAPIATQTAAATEGASRESVQPISDARALADNAQDAAQAASSTDSARGVKASVVSEPIEMSIVAVLGLVVAGLLFRIAMTARRRRIFIVRPESHWLDYRNEHVLRDEQQSAGPVYQRRVLINDFIDRTERRRMDDRNKLSDRQQPSGTSLAMEQEAHARLTGLTSTRREQLQSHRPVRGNHDLRENPHRRDRDLDVTSEVSKPEDMLEQLKRDLDRLLRSPKVA